MDQPKINLAPILWGRVHAGRNNKTIKVLLDSGASARIIDYDVVQGLPIQKEISTTWATAAGNMQTNQKVTTMLMLPEFFDQRVIKFTYHVTTTKSRCQLVVGRDLLQ